MRYVKPNHLRGEFRDQVILYGVKFNLDSGLAGRGEGSDSKRILVIEPEGLGRSECELDGHRWSLMKSISM